MQRFLSRQWLLQTFGLLLRYAISGFAGIGANLVVFSVMVVWLEIWYIFASLAGFVAAYLVTFLMHKYWTFKELSPERFYKQSVVYFFSAVATLGLSTAILYLLVTFFGLPPVWAQLLALFLSAGASFFFTTLVTFHAESNRLQMFVSYFDFGLLAALRTHRRELLALLMIAAFIVVLRTSLFPLTPNGDAASYLATAEHFLGVPDAAVHGERILKPLAPAMVAGLSFLGVPLELGLLVQSIVFYVLLALAVYWFGWQVFKKSSHAFLSALIVITAYPIVRYGVDFMTETGIWALYFASLAVIVAWVDKPRFKLVCLLSLFLLLGLLFKEYIVLVGAMFALAVLTQPQLRWGHKFHVLLQTAFLVLIPWLAWQYAVYEWYDYTYLDWLAIGAAAEAYENEYTLYKIGKTTFALLFAVWGLVAWGVYHWSHVTARAQRLFWLMLLPSFGFLLWGYVSSRLFFSIVPLVLPLAVVGFFALPSRRAQYLVAGVIVICNSVLIALAFSPSMRELLNALS